MTIRIAKNAGFCFGVKRAVNMVYEEARLHPGSVYTIGPIIHNEQVVEDLREKGVRILDEDLMCAEDGSVPDGSSTVIIRSHGISKELQDRIVATGCRIVDATCPFVEKIHDIARNASKEGQPVVIVGNPSHPEVLGIRGWAEGPCAVVESVDDVKRLSFPKEQPLRIVSQTTFNFRKFQEIVENIELLGYSLVVTNTICNATRERQKESLDLAKQSDFMIVIGGKNSSNTQKLYDICKSQCKNTCYIQSAKDLSDMDLSAMNLGEKSRVGITAGASTPNSIIQEVSLYVRRTEL